MRAGMLKRGIRILGIDDAPFKRGTHGRVLVVGVVWRDGIFEGVLSTHVQIDGDDSTVKILKMIERSRFARQIKLVMLHGIMFGGFNVVDIKKISQKLNIPVIGITRRKPNMAKVIKALQNVRNFKAKLKKIERAGPSLRLDGFYGQLARIDSTIAQKVLQRFGIAPIRAAHIIASGVVSGESSGRI